MVPGMDTNYLGFFIVDTNETPVIGVDSCRAIGLVKIEDRALSMTRNEVATFKAEYLPEKVPGDIA